MAITLRINGGLVDLGTVWVHLQDVDALEARGYQLLVEKVDAADVFSTGDEYFNDDALTKHIQESIREFGTFIVEGYFLNALRRCDSQRHECKWVIATVKSIKASAAGVTIVGSAVKFGEK